MDKLDTARQRLASALDTFGRCMEENAAKRSASMMTMREMADAQELRAERDKLVGAHRADRGGIAYARGRYGGGRGRGSTTPSPKSARRCNWSA